MHNLVDKSVIYTEVIIENVLIKVKGLVFPIDFVILDIEEDVDFSLILEHLILHTSRDLLDMEKGMLLL